MPEKDDRSLPVKDEMELVGAVHARFRSLMYELTLDATNYLMTGRQNTVFATGIVFNTLKLINDDDDWKISFALALDEAFRKRAAELLERANDDRPMD